MKHRVYKEYKFINENIHPLTCMETQKVYGDVGIALQKFRNYIWKQLEKELKGRRGPYYAEMRRIVNWPELRESSAYRGKSKKEFFRFASKKELQSFINTLTFHHSVYINAMAIEIYIAEDYEFNKVWENC